MLKWSTNRAAGGNAPPAVFRFPRLGGTRLTTTPESLPGIEQILDRLRSIEAALQILVREKTVKEWYSTAEVAKLLGKAEYTVREWCRQKRLLASKKHYARGAHPEWLIGHDELQRLRNRGLLPVNSNAAPK